MAAKPEFLFIIPDASSGTANRAAATDPHEVFVAETKDHWLAGGPIFTDHESKGLKGSWVLLQADSKDEAVNLLKRDPFVTGGVWDLDKAEIHSVKSGLRVGFVKDSIKANYK